MNILVLLGMYSYLQQVLNVWFILQLPPNFSKNGVVGIISGIAGPCKIQLNEKL